MALTNLLSVATVPNLFLLFVAYWVIWIVYCRTLHPLARVPGPLWPAVSRTWQSTQLASIQMSYFTDSPVQLKSCLNTVYHTYRCDAERAQAALHKKYGPLVRVSPTEVVTCDPAAIPLIYPTQNALPKSEWYVPFRPQGISEQADLFSETDEQKYSKHRRIVQPAYQMGNVLKNEEEINRATKLLVEKLKELAAKKENVDLGHWIELYTYDVIGSVMFGHEFGFLKSGNDVGSFIGAVDTAAMLLHFMAATPSYMRGVIMLAALCIPGMPKKLRAIQATAEEAKRQTELGMQRSAEESDSRHDIMSQLLRIVKDKGFKENFTHREVTLGAWIGIMAGSDSTAANMRAVLYYLMKNPRCMAAVVKEIAEQEHQNLLSNPITYAESKNCLPYMGACIKEAQRLYASIGTSMPRVTPAQGIVLSGYYIPGGYDVGVNPHNAHHDTKLFGKDAKEFRPERWLESPERSFEMEKGMAFWGAGTRTCVGKNIALAEIHKLLPELLRQFDMRMAHNEPWETRTAGFIKQRNVIVTLKERV